MTSDLITVADAAAIIGAERQTVYRYIREGKLPAEHIARHVFVHKGDAEAIAPGKQGWTPRHIPDEREWTRAMTIKRLDEWNNAVNAGTFDDPDTGRVSSELVHKWEQEHGWTRDDLLASADRHFDNRVNG